MDFIEDFLHFAAGVGCAPASGEQIAADDMRHYFTIDGDKPNSKKGGYQLKIEGEFAVGWITNYRLGETHTYTSKSAKKFTVEEKAAWKAKIDARKKEQKSQLDKIRLEAAAQAKSVWSKAAKTGEHPYLKRKQCALNGARIADGKLIVPIYKDGKLTSLQYISADGDKMFLKGGEVSGGWFPIADKDQDKSILCLAEGYATACSIRKATGLPLIVCFNAKNIIPVSKAIRKKYPDAQIIIGADNDSTKEINVGLDCAKQAASAIGGAIVIHPEFKESDKGSDWNDYYALYGEDAVKEVFNKALHAHQPQATPMEAYEQEQPVINDITPGWIDEMPPLEAYDDEERKTVALYAAG